MERYFNVEGACNPKEHYMVRLDQRLLEIEKLVEHRKYFTINRGRQYGKTTTLNFLQEKLKMRYAVFYISFEGIAEESYRSETAFCRMFAGLLGDTVFYGETDGIAGAAAEGLRRMGNTRDAAVTFRELSNLITEICSTAEKPVVLMIDEVDQEGAYPVFLTFLGMLRSQYLKRDKRAAFWSVILAGVHDIRNLKLKMQSGEEAARNSPWNIAAKFTVDMSFSEPEIRELLLEYENDHRSGMDADEMAKLLNEYTSGYPFLVSSLCKILDEEVKIWTKEGFLEAVRIFSADKNTLFESLVNKLQDYPKLREMIYAILFLGDAMIYDTYNSVMDIASMYGFVKNEHGMLAIANRIFEMRLHQMFLSECLKRGGDKVEKYTILDLFEGQYYEKNFVITADMGRAFAEISQDYNPIHLDEKAAAESRFGQRIVHGMLIGSYFSGIIGNQFPGPGSVYISQDISFKAPVYYDTEVTIRVEVMSVNPEKKHVLLKTTCTCGEKLLVDGQARILFE